MTVRVYRHSDAGAPVLTGQAGGGLPVLRACLVDGYGAKAAAGWTEAYTGTNKAVFVQGAGSNGMAVRIDDTTTATMRIRGYEAMTGIDDGTGPFPTDAQVSGGGYVLKSSTTDSTARPWMLIATEKAFYFWVGYNLTDAAGISGSAASMPMVFFGDIVSYKTGDAFNTQIICGSTAALSGNVFAKAEYTIAVATAGHYMARAFTQIGAAVAIGKTIDYARMLGGATLGAAGTSYPDAVSGGMLLSPIFINENTSSVTRGVMPGAWAPLHPLPGSPGDTFSGTGDLAGKDFILLDCGNSSTRGRIAIEISNTW